MTEPGVGRPRVLVIGLDCATPELLFDRWSAELPVLTGLRDRGTFGSLHSVHPPITVPAWASMLTGRDPGALGIYGFRSRRDRSYDPPTLNTASALTVPTVWDLLALDGRDSIVVGFPPSYPPKPIRGCMVSGMLTPPSAATFTWPASLSNRIREQAPDYRFDTDLHRTGRGHELAEDVRGMTRTRFRVMRDLLGSEPWSFAFVHEIGLDRIQHAYWDGVDEPQSHGYETLLDYHRLLDAEIGELLEIVPEETAVAVVSDHGARRLEGVFVINEWLVREGYLCYTEPPSMLGPLDPSHVDWARTRAWADGGYCGRVYLNVRGRQPEGILGSDEARRTRDEIRAKLEALRGPDGEPLGTAVYYPEEVYAAQRGVPPDLIVYPGDLRFRCSGSVGFDRIFLDKNDTGTDAANHTWEGMFLWAEPDVPGIGRVEGRHILDVAPTVLEHLNVPVPGNMPGARLRATI